jgi:hypothetical protein
MRAIISFVVLVLLFSGVSGSQAQRAKDFGYIYIGGKGAQTLTERCGQGIAQGDCIYDPGFVDPDNANYRLDAEKVGLGICCKDGVIIPSELYTTGETTIEKAGKVPTDPSKFEKLPGINP